MRPFSYFQAGKSIFPIIVVAIALVNTSFADDILSDEASQARLNEAVLAVEKSLEKAKSIDDFTPPILPNPGKDRGELIVDSSNVSYFYELLLPNMAEWVSNKSFILSVDAKTKYEWALHEKQESLNQSSSENKIIESLLKSQASLSESIYKLKFSWFDKKGISREASANLARNYKLKNLSIKSPPASKQVAPKSEKASPQLGPLPKPDLLANYFMNEFLFFISPPAIFSYTQVLNRPRDKEDNIWHFSPVIGLGRPLYNANRGDAMFDSAFSMDDLFVWSANPSLQEIEFVKKTEMLLPVVSLESFASAPEKLEVAHENFISPNVKGASLQSASSFKAKGEQITTDEEEPTQEPELVSSLEGHISGSGSGNSFVVWNSKSRKHPNAANWLPSTAKFVPREVYIFEITTKDPYYPGGRQTLVVDAESLLPVYKVCYSRTGRYQKTVIGMWGFSSSNLEIISEKAPIKLRPFLASLLVVDFYNLAVAVDTEKVHFLGEKSPRLKSIVKDFYDPKKFEELINPKPKPKEEKKEGEEEAAKKGEEGPKKKATQSSGAKKENSKKKKPESGSTEADSPETASPEVNSAEAVASEEKPKAKEAPKKKTSAKRVPKEVEEITPSERALEEELNLWDQEEF